MPTPPRKNRPGQSAKAAKPKPASLPAAKIAPPAKSPASPYSALSAAASPSSAGPAAFARISRRASESLRNGHLWVYASDVEHVEFKKESEPGSPQTALRPWGGEPPALIPVVDNRGIPLGTALLSPNSQITLRLVSREIIDEKAWLNLLSERIRTAIDRRRPFLNADNDAARLVFSEADNLPGLIIDKYANIVILQLLSKGLDTAATRELCVETLSQSLQDPSLTIWERPDPRIRQLENLSAPSTEPLYHRAGHSAEGPVASTTFHLNGLSFHFDASSGQKTGAFLDQRQNYAAAAHWAQAYGAKQVLDVCTYQGGFALHLARVCTHVTAVDASHASLEVAERNLELNRSVIAPETEVEWIEADAFDLLRDWAKDSSASTSSRKEKNEGNEEGQEPGTTANVRNCDLIVLDPPAFAKSRRAVEGALRGYKELNLRALQLLKPGGLLITCSCSHHVSLADLESAVASAAVDAHRRVTLLERRGAALDHPVLLSLPETEYLKCLICQVD
jgi:23S rRNA (cytosine1962-C5)-methyltransferase